MPRSVVAGSAGGAVLAVGVAVVRRGDVAAAGYGSLGSAAIRAGLVAAGLVRAGRRRGGRVSGAIASAALTAMFVVSLAATVLDVAGWLALPPSRR